MDAEQAMAEALERTKRQMEIAETLDPSLPDLTRIIMAGDIAGAERVLDGVRKGEITADQALIYSGSYSRMTTLVTLVDEGFMPLDDALDRLPKTWPVSDPDDTDRRFVDLWQQAFDRKGGLVTDEGYRLPGRSSILIVWRGQRRVDRFGCAWSLDRNVAERFAQGASFRTAIEDPVLVELKVPRDRILAYLTGRGEEEVIIDPAGINDPADSEETK